MGKEKIEKLVPCGSFFRAAVAGESDSGGWRGDREFSALGWRDAALCDPALTDATFADVSLNVAASTDSSSTSTNATDAASSDAA